MRLTARLSLFVGLGMLLVFAGHAAIRVHRDLLRYERDIVNDHRVLAIAVATAVEDVVQVEGPERARALVERINQREGNVLVQWVDASDDHPAAVAPTTPVRDDAQRYPSTQRVELDGRSALVTHAALRTPGHPRTAIELVEPLHDEDDYAREAIARTASTTAVALALCIAIITAFGIWFVGRPIRALRDHAHRVAAGDLDARTALSTRDELGDLARDMDEMTLEIRHARERVREQETERAEIMSQLRHVDRLRAVGEMASAVAHDLGTPMSTVRARAQMIAGGEIGEDRGRQLAAGIVTEFDRMSSAIQRLLGHARRTGPTRAEIDVHAWAREVVELLRPLAERRGVRIEQVQAGDVRASLDPHEMRQAVTNLVVNALDATPRGGQVRLSVRAEGTGAIVEVTDHGVGMTPEMLSRVFEPFFTTKEEGRGTGLGLTIARGVVEELGVRLTIESVPGRGTTVAIHLPR